MGKFWNFLNGQILKFSQWTYFEIFSGQILQFSHRTNFAVFSMDRFCNILNGLILKFSQWTNFEIFTRAWAYGSRRRSLTLFCHLPFVHRQHPVTDFTKSKVGFSPKLTNFFHISPQLLFFKLKSGIFQEIFEIGPYFGHVIYF